MTNEKANANELSDAEILKTPPPNISPLPGMFAEGTQVKIKNTILTGIVDSYHLSKDGKVFSYLVQFKNEEGVEHEKAFLHNQIEEIK